MCSIINYSSSLYLLAVDKFQDNIAMLENLRAIADAVTEEDMTLFIECAPEGNCVEWSKFEHKYKNFLDFFRSEVASIKDKNNKELAESSESDELYIQAKNSAC